MAKFVIEGGYRLSGEITPAGAKNEALQVICATLLSEGEIEISNVPDILDVNNLIQLLINLGVSVRKISKDTYIFCASNVNLNYIETEEFAKSCTMLRGSVMLIGPLLARFGKAIIPQPGGDKIG